MRKKENTKIQRHQRDHIIELIHKENDLYMSAMV